MLEVLKDEKGDILAVCEWWLVNADGTFNIDADIVWIAEVEINPAHRSRGVLKYFIKAVTDKCPNAKAGYFWRLNKYPSRKPHLYTRKQWLKLI